VALVLRLLSELLEAPELTKPAPELQANDDDWVMLRESGDSRLLPGIQSQDDLELFFAQIPLLPATEYAMRGMDEIEGLQMGVQAIRLLLDGAKRFSMHDHFSKLLGNSALRSLQIWAESCGGARRQKHCAESVLESYLRYQRRGNNFFEVFFPFFSRSGRCGVFFAMFLSDCARQCAWRRC
jgi:hypothetical protein